MQIKELYTNKEEINIYTYLQKCGISNVDLYLDNSYIESIDNYNNIYNMADELLKSIKFNENIYLLIDCDNDGFMSATISYIYFKRLNNDIEIIPIFHNENPKAHGLEDEEVMTFLREQSPSVLFITDAGTNDCNKCKELKELGWSIYIADHHQKSQDNPYALIVNNQMSVNVKNKQLCGCGVTHKVLSKIDELNDTHYASDLISFVNCANISDSCCFTNPEQQTYRYWGNENIHPNLLPFINEFNNDLTNNGFSFGVISRFNAVIRAGTLEEKNKLFYSLCTGINTEEVIQICKDCREKQNKEKEELLQNVEIITDKNVVLGKTSKTSLTGLMANALMQQYNKPIMLLHDRENGEVAGSCRCPNGIPLRKLFNESGLFNYNQGHDFAYGTSYQKENESLIINYIDNVLNVLEPHIDVLKSYSIKSIPTRLFGLFEPYSALWGHGVNKPKFHIKNITFTPSDWSIIGKNKRTLKLHKEGIDIMIFNCLKKDKEDLQLGHYENDIFVSDPSNNKLQMDCVGELSVNEWNGQKKLQIIVDKMEIKCYNKPCKDDLF